MIWIILVFRLDFGVPLHLPYDTDRSGYYNVTGAFMKNLGNTFCYRLSLLMNDFLYDFGK